MSPTVEPRRRRRLPAVVVAVLLLSAAIVAADIAVRAYVSDRIETSVRTGLGIQPDVPVEVDVEGFSVLAQLATGRLSRIELSSDSVTFGELTGAADVTAIGVPLDRAQPVEGLTLAFSVAESELEALSANLSGLPITSVAIEGSEIQISAEFAVFGLAVPLGVGLEPEAVDGRLAFTPSSITLSNATFTADELRRQFGRTADTALQTQDFCVAQYLPSVFVLDSAELRGHELSLGFEAPDVILGDETFAAMGTCQ